jgi:hypothetical protein
MPSREEFYGYFDSEEGQQAVYDNIVAVSEIDGVPAPSFEDMKISTELPEKLRKRHGIPTKYSAGVVPEFLYDRNPDTGKPARIFIDEEGVTAVGDRSELPPNPNMEKDVEALRNQMLNTHLMRLLSEQTSIQTEDPRLKGMREFVGEIDPVTGERSLGVLGMPHPFNPFFIMKSMNDGILRGVKEINNMYEDVRAGRITEDSAQYKVRGLAAFAKMGASAITPISTTLQVFNSGLKLAEQIPNEDFQNIMKFVLAPGTSLAEKYFKLSDKEKKSVGNYGVDPTILAIGELVDLTVQALVAKGAHKVAGGAGYSAARYRAWKEGRLNLTPGEAKFYGETEMSQLHKVIDRVVKDDWHFRHEKPGVLAYGPGDATSYIEVLAPKKKEGGKNKTAFVVTRPDGSAVLANTLGEAKALAYNYYVDNGYLNLDRFKPITTFEVSGTDQSALLQLKKNAEFLERRIKEEEGNGIVNESIDEQPGGLSAYENTGIQVTAPFNDNIYRPAVKLADGTISYTDRGMHTDALERYLQEKGIDRDTFDYDQVVDSGVVGPDGKYYTQRAVGDIAEVPETTRANMRIEGMRGRLEEIRAEIKDIESQQSGAIVTPTSSKRITGDSNSSDSVKATVSPEFETRSVSLQDITSVTRKGVTRSLPKGERKTSFSEPGLFEKGEPSVKEGDFVTVDGKKYSVKNYLNDSDIVLQSLEPKPPSKSVTASAEAIEKLSNPTPEVDATISAKTNKLGLSKEFEATVAGIQPLIKQVGAEVAKMIRDKVLPAGKRQAAIRDGIMKAIQSDPNYKNLSQKTRSQLYAVANSVGRKLHYDVKSAELLMPEEMKNLQAFRDLTYQAKIQEQITERLLRSGLTAEQLQELRPKLAEYFSDAVADVTKSQRLSYFYSKLAKITRELGYAGAEAVTKLHDADARFRILDNERRVLLADIRVLRDQMRKDGRTIEFTRIARQVADALEHQDKAAEILGSSPEAKMFYDKAKQFLDYYRGLLKEAGIETLDNYFPHMSKMSGMEAALRKKLAGEAHVDDIGIARLYSKIDADAANLLERRDALKSWDTNALDVLDQYASQVNRQLAYTDAIDWLYNRNEGFRSKLAPSLQRRVGVGGRLTEPIRGMSELINYYRDSIFRKSDSGWAYDTLQKANINFMRSVISYSLKNKFQNRLQIHLARANWSPEANDLFLSTRKGAYKKGLTHELGLSGDLGIDHPNIAKFLEETSRFIPESVDQMIGESLRTELAKREGVLTRAFNKYDWFAASEIKNWKDVLLGNMYDLAMRTPEYAEALKKYDGRGDLQSQRLSAINDVLGNKERFERIMQKAGLLTAETQVSTLPAMRAHAYDNRWGRLILAFTQFKFRQFQMFMEHMPGRQSGSKGANAYTILRRGEEGEVIPVELLREVEIERKAIDAALKQDKDLGFDRQTMKLYSEFLHSQEKELNIQIKSLAKRPSGAQRTMILGRYFATNALISGVFGAAYRWIDEQVESALKDDDTDQVGSDVKMEEEKDDNFYERFAYNLLKEVSPIPIDPLNPAGTIGVRFFPRDDGRPLKTEELTKLGFSIAPWYVSAPNRLLGKAPEKLTTKIINEIGAETFPKEDQKWK